MPSLVVVRQRPRPLIGTCGPVPDRQFDALEADLDWLELHGVAVERIDPAAEPAALESIPEAARAWREAGPAALPLVLANGSIVSRGHLPSHRELVRVAASPSTCSIETIRHVAALAVATALTRDEDRARERALAEAAGLDAARLDAVEDEARRVAKHAAPTAR